MRPKSMVLIALALGCGVVASIGSIQLMDARNNQPEQGERQQVFVAMTDIGPNQVLDAQNIKVEEWPKNIVPAGALTKLEEVEGKRLRVKLYAGEPILTSKLAGADDVGGAAKDIPPGYRVAPVKIDSISGSSNLIMPGDRVDVLVFRNTNSDLNATAARIVLQDVKVFAVDTHTETAIAKNQEEQNEPITARTISLLVTPEQSLILHTASEISGVVRLVLRNPEDDAHVNTSAVTVGDIFGPEIKGDRNAEKMGKGKDSDITEWLTQQKQEQPQAPQAPEPPATPIRQHKMIVMLGSEVSQIDFPENGDLPNQPPKTSSPGSAPPTSAPRVDTAPSEPASEPSDQPEGEDSPSDT